jgi:hypothetical protein
MCFAVSGEANQFQSKIPCRNRGGNWVTLTNACVDLHVHAHGLIRGNDELLRLTADTFAHAILNIENIIPRR